PLPSCLSVKPYMYSRLTRAFSSVSRISASPPGSSATSMATRSETFTTKPSFSNSCLAFSQSRRTRRRMPNCCVSAMESVRMLSLAWASSLTGRLSAPGLFSRNNESCLTFMVGSPRGYIFRWSTTRLAFAALNGARLDQPHVGPHAHGGLDGPAEPVLQLFERPHRVGEDFRCDLDLHLHHVEVPLARQDNLVVRQRAFHLQQGGLDLRRIDVDAANDEHVVGAAP